MKTLGTWMYQAVLNPDIVRYIQQFVNQEMPSRNQNFELYKNLDVRRAQWLFRRASYIVNCIQRESVLLADMLFNTWDDLDLDSEEDMLDLPPHRYEVHIKLGPQGLHQFYLTPAEFTAVTLVEADVGRLIGDALDGPKPQA